MAIINGKALVKDGKAVDKVFSNGRQVYGRNLLKGTINSDSMFGFDYFGQTWWSYPFANGENVQNQGLSVGDTLTCEFDWEVSNPTSGSFILQLNGMENQELSETISITSENKSGHSKFSFVVDAKLLNGIDTRIQYRADYLPYNSMLTISNLTLAKGSPAQPWTPAPEDYI
mgnify:CR=1 FL=1